MEFGSQPPRVPPSRSNAFQFHGRIARPPPLTPASPARSQITEPRETTGRPVSLLLSRPLLCRDLTASGTVLRPRSSQGAGILPRSHAWNSYFGISNSRCEPNGVRKEVLAGTSMGGKHQKEKGRVENE
jgi:hypothetical protein